MKNQALFSSKDKSKKLKCHLLQFWFGALRVKYSCSIFKWHFEYSFTSRFRQLFCIIRSGSEFGMITVTGCTCKVPKKKKKENSETSNNVNPDEVAHNEPPHLDLHYLPSSL